MSIKLPSSFTPEQAAYVEKYLQSFRHWRDANLPVNRSAEMAKRRAYEAHRLPPDLQAEVDEWLGQETPADDLDQSASGKPGRELFGVIDVE